MKFFYIGLNLFSRLYGEKLPSTLIQKKNYFDRNWAQVPPPM